MEPKPPISIKNYKEKKKEIISYIFLNIKLVLFKMFLNKKNVLIFLVNLFFFFCPILIFFFFLYQKSSFSVSKSEENKYWNDAKFWKWWKYFSKYFWR